MGRPNIANELTWGRFTPPLDYQTIEQPVIQPWYMWVGQGRADSGGGWGRSALAELFIRWSLICGQDRDVSGRHCQSSCSHWWGSRYSGSHGEHYCRLHLRGVAVAVVACVWRGPVQAGKADRPEQGDRFSFN